MQKLSFYEQVGVVIPGAVFLFGAMFFVSELRELFAKDGFNVGGLGVFVIVSYAAGHLLAGLGNATAKGYWKFKGGMPSDWIVGATPRLLSSAQIARVEELTAARLRLTLPPLSELTPKEWFPVFRQIYSDVEKNGKPARGDIFNGNYGLNRGLCSATLALSIVVFVRAPDQWGVSLALIGASVAYLYRMHTFGVSYAREIYNQFLLLPPEPGKPKKAGKSDSDPAKIG